MKGSQVFGEEFTQLVNCYQNGIEWRKLNPSH